MRESDGSSGRSLACSGNSLALSMGSQWARSLARATGIHCRPSWQFRNHVQSADAQGKDGDRGKMVIRRSIAPWSRALRRAVRCNKKRDSWRACTPRGGHKLASRRKLMLPRHVREPQLQQPHRRASSQRLQRRRPRAAPRQTIFERRS